MIKFITTASFAAVVVASMIAQPAFADTIVSTTSVSYADLNLSSTTGQARMQSRMHRAAQQVCGYDVGTRDLNQIASQNACVSTAMKGAQVALAAATNDSNSTQRVAVSDSADRNVPGRAH